MSKSFDAFAINDDVLTIPLYESFTKAEKSQIKAWTMGDVWFGAQKIFRSMGSLPLQPCHREFCYSLVQPNPDVDIQQWDSTKERTLLCFRGFGKTTLSSVHILQCILCCPNIRILLVGGVVAHAEKKMRAIVDLFNNTPIIEHLLPDFYNASVKSAPPSFTTPARTLNLREPTITCGSFRSTLASGHYELVSCDDAANDSNQGTAAAVEKSLIKFDDLAPLVEPDCYIDYIGVRTDAADIPSQIFARSLANGTPLGGVEIPVFTVKEGTATQADKKDKLNLNLATDVDFAWPQRWNEKTLQRVYTLPNFRENYLLEIFEPVDEPLPEALTPEIINKCVTNEQADVMQVPVLNADMANVGVTGKDCCAFIGGYWNPETRILMVTGIVNKKFVEKEDFLKQVLTLHKSLRFVNLVRFRCENNKNEKSAWEVDFNKIQMAAEFQMDSVLGRRQRDFEALSEAIRTGKVKFGTDLTQQPEWQDLIKQLCNFYDSRLERDDVADSLGQLWRYCQTITNAEPHTYPFEG